MLLLDAIIRNENSQTKKIMALSKRKSLLVYLYYFPLCLLGLAVGAFAFVASIIGGFIIIVSIFDLSAKQFLLKLPGFVFIGPFLCGIGLVWIRLCWKILFSIFSRK